MTAPATIDSDDLTVEELFKDFYVVPDYQREYVWETDQVEQLLDDVYEEYTSPDGPAEYFIGSLVAVGMDDGTFELIDGQQRVTTLFVALCVIRDYLRELGEDESSTLKSQIASTSVDMQGRDVYRYRVALQYKDSSGVLEAIGAGKLEELDVEETRSVGNIRNAYRTSTDFLKRQFGEDADAIRKFYAYLIKKVKLIRVKALDMAQALKVFETINDRGVGLDSMDLLKNLLFRNSEREEFDELKKKWKKLVDTLYQAKEKPLRFLRYFIFAEYKADRLREDEIYRWLVKHDDQVKYQQAPLSFSEKLVAAAKAYVRFVDGKNPDGSPNRYLENLKILSGAARQHMILLLAGRHLPKEAFVELTRHLENLFFAYIVTRESTREFERTFVRWGHELREVRDLDGLEEFIKERITPAKRSLASRFELTFRELDAHSIQKYRMKYILAKLTQFVDEKAQGSDGAVADLKTYTVNSVQVEHILPQTPSEEVLEAFEESEEIEEYIQRLGNLALLEKSINTSAGNGLFEEKQPKYKMSNFLLTKSLATEIRVGRNTAYDRAATHLETFDSWQSDDIERRQRMLARLARLTWDIPEVEIEKDAEVSA